MALQHHRGRRAARACKPGGTIVEATSGNTGMRRWRWSRRMRGYKCVFVMPDKMSPGEDRQRCARSAPRSSSARPPSSRRIRAATTRSPSASSTRRRTRFYANQYHNPANPEAHYLSTGPEIWEQTGGEIDVFVAGMGTGGTISRRAESIFKEKKPGFRLVRRRSDRLALLRVRQDRPHDQAVRLQRRGDRRGLLAEHDEPQDHRRDRARRRQGVLPDDARAGARRRGSSSAALAARRWRAPSSTPSS